MADKKTVQIILDLQDEMSRDLKKIKSQMVGFGKAGGAAERKTSRLGSTIAKVAGIIGTAFIAKKMFDFGSAIIKVSGDFEQFNVAFTTMLGSSEKAKTLLDDIKMFAKETPFELPAIVEGSKRLLAYNVSAEKIIPTLTTLGNIAAGVGVEKMPQLITAFGQVGAKGRLMGQELLQFTEAGVNLGGALQTAFGVTRGELEKMISTGKVSFGAVEAALDSLGQGSGKFAGLMVKQSLTLQGAWSNVSDTIIQTFLAWGNAILPQMKRVVGFVLEQAGRIQTWAEDNQEIIAAYFKTFFEGAIDLGKGLFKLGQFFYEYLIDPIRQAFSLPVVKWIAGITAGIWLLQIAFTALVAANPFAWVVMGVGAAIIAITYLIKNWDVCVAFFKSSLMAIQEWFAGLAERLSGIALKIGGVFKGVGELIFLALTGKFAEIKGAFAALQADIKGVLVGPSAPAGAQPVSTEAGSALKEGALQASLDKEKAIRDKANEDEQAGAIAHNSSLTGVREAFLAEKAESDATIAADQVTKTEEEFARIEEKNLGSVEAEMLKLENLKALREQDGIDQVALEDAINKTQTQITLTQDKKERGTEEKKLLDLLKLRKKKGIDTVLLEKTITKQREAVQIEHAAKDIAREKKSAALSFKILHSSLQHGFDALTTFLEMGTEESKAAAIALKVIRVGEAIMNTWAGASLALATVPFPASIFAVASVVATGLANVAKITGVQFAEGTADVPGRGNKDTVPSLLTPGEMVIPPTFAEGIRAGDISLGGAGEDSGEGSSSEVNININNPVFYGDPDIGFVKDVFRVAGEGMMNNLISPLPEGA